MSPMVYSSAWLMASSAESLARCRLKASMLADETSAACSGKAVPDNSSSPPSNDGMIVLLDMDSLQFVNTAFVDNGRGRRHPTPGSRIPNLKNREKTM